VVSHAVSVEGCAQVPWDRVDVVGEPWSRAVGGAGAVVVQGDLEFRIRSDLFNEQDVSLQNRTHRPWSLHKDFHKHHVGIGTKRLRLRVSNRLESGNGASIPRIEPLSC
jgi:hypothetical protein